MPKAAKEKPGKRITLDDLNKCNRVGFVAVCGPLFEHSPWIARRAFDRRPFETLEQLHAALVAVVQGAKDREQIGLIAAHPDLVGRLAREGLLTRESNKEQAAAGLARLTDAEIAAFDGFNTKYKKKFSIPFVICARENKKDAILAAFPVRLKHGRRQEIATALAEIAKIARLRLLDAVSEK